MGESTYNCETAITVLSDAAPVVIGGIGGSGTRLMAQLLMELGFDMGSDLNDSLDDLGFTALFKRLDIWPIDNNRQQLDEALAVFLTSRGFPTPTTVTAVDHRNRTEALIGRIEKNIPWLETGTIQDRMKSLSQLAPRKQRWGWKEPNTLVVLPYLLQALPNLTYIHVLRDGRDMAYSGNKNQLQLWGTRLLGRPVNTRSAQDALDYWCVAHERLLDLVQQHGGRILVVKLESLIDQLPSTLTRILDFLGCDDIATYEERFAPLVKMPRSIGRYQGAPALKMTREQIDLFEKLG